MDKNAFANLQVFKEQLKNYYGTTKLQNIPAIASSELLQNFSSLRIDIDATVAQTIQKINDVLNMESIMFQFGKFQKEIRDKHILLSHRLAENQRVEFAERDNLHEWLEGAFSHEQYYFTINPSSFRKGDKKHNREVFQHAVDTVIIDPAKVSEESLETLGITLDPDCQNLKEIFKKMQLLNYQAADETKHTKRINGYDGKYITFNVYKTVFDATQPATKGEQRKEDVKFQMAIYPDIFSLIRREEYIIEGSEKKKGEYEDIKKKLIESIKEIDWNKKSYSIRVQQNVKVIIDEIDQATSARIMADKLYHLYKITGAHSANDKKLLEASMRNFNRRIAQLIGISYNTQLHLVALNDTLENQNMNLEYFYRQISMFFADPTTRYSTFLLAFENYYKTQKGPINEPFRTFDNQIKQCFGDVEQLRKQDSKSVILKAEIIISLQRKIRETYTWEHAYKKGEMSVEEIQSNLLDTSSYDTIKKDMPGLYDTLFVPIDKKRAEFRSDFTKTELNRFFDELNDLTMLQNTIDVLNNMFNY